jgi:glycosyltransferase involved in cell wall biosynthesis
MTLFIVDIIGKHSGAHFYNKSFMNVLKRNYSDVKIISNYNEPPEDKPPLFDNYYAGNFIKKIFKLLKSLLKYYLFVLRYRKSCFIFLSYGNAYEILFVWPLKFCKINIVDIHEVISLITNNRIQHLSRTWFSKIIYKHVTDAVIIHSERTNSLLDEIGYTGSRLGIPHFSYEIDISFNISEISSEVLSLISRSAKNILFFGFIRLSKGVDTAIALANKAATSSVNPDMNFIIAGNDPDNLVIPFLKRQVTDSSGKLSLLLRYINDEEMKYLFSSSDYVFLPYKEISQSGVLEMAVRFRKPVITSSLSFFEEFLALFPSFGILCEKDNVDAFYHILEDLTTRPEEYKNKFYTDSDLDKFNDYKNPENFLREMAKIIPAEN